MFILKNCMFVCQLEMFSCSPVKKAVIRAICSACKVCGQCEVYSKNHEESSRDVCPRVFADTLICWPHLWRTPPFRNKRILYWHNSEEAKEVQQLKSTGMSISQMWQFSGPHAHRASQCPPRVTCCSSPTAGNLFYLSVSMHESEIVNMPRVHEVYRVVCAVGNKSKFPFLSDHFIFSWPAVPHTYLMQALHSFRNQAAML